MPDLVPWLLPSAGAALGCAAYALVRLAFKAHRPVPVPVPVHAATPWRRARRPMRRRRLGGR